jgi:FtsZ-interacting cell division protein ZipA
LDVLKQTGSVEDYANKFQSLVAEIVAMPPSEGDLLQKFSNGLKPDIQMVASIDPVTGTRWMNLQEFISFACATDASRAQANKGKQASDKSEQGKSSSSGASYKDKLKGKRPTEPSNGQPTKKSKTGQEKQKSKQKAKDWEHNSCFICHKIGRRAKECPDKPKNTRVDFAKTK